MEKQLTCIISVSAILGVFFGAYTYIDTRYALKEKVLLVENRLEQKIKHDEIMNLQQRIWQLEDRLEIKPDNSEIKKEIRRIECERDNLDKQLTTLRARKYK